MKTLVILLALLFYSLILANGESSAPVWREETKPLWHHGDESWLKWPEQTRKLRDDRPLWRRIASSFAIWTDARDIKDLPATADLGERIRNYEIAIGIKFTIFF